MNYDDETLMAYADGELDEARRIEIAAAIEKNPELAQRVAAHRALRTEVSGAFAGVLDQAMPERLRNAARGGPAAPARGTGNVVQFPSRSTRAPATTWRAREWTAMAASLVLGGLLSWQFMARSGGDIGTQGGSLVAKGGLAEALSTQLASNQPEDAEVRIGLSFMSQDREYCRSFVSRGSSAAGLACRSGATWRIPVLQSVTVPEGDVRTAAVSMPKGVLDAIETRLAGEPFDANLEKVARDAGWGFKPAPQN